VAIQPEMGQVYTFKSFLVIVLGGAGNYPGALLGGLLLGLINNYLIPDVLNDLPSRFGLHFQLTSVEFGIFGFLLVIVMVLRPQGLVPERRRKLEFTTDMVAGDTQLADPSTTTSGGVA